MCSYLFISAHGEIIIEKCRRGQLIDMANDQKRSRDEIAHTVNRPLK